MPANLPPQYFEAEKRFRTARSPEEKIMALEEMLAIMPKHKGTDHLKADLRRKIAKLSQEAERKSGAKRASMLIEKEGAAQVVVVGMPNAGKSRLVASLTNASPVAAEYPFTTQRATPGMMDFENIKIQLVDTPPLTEQPAEWWLRNTIIRADGIVIVVDLSGQPLAQMETILRQLAEMRVGIGDINTGEEDSLILHPKKAIVIANKVDLGNSEGYLALRNRYAARVSVSAVSAEQGNGLELLRHEIFKMLDIIRVYTKAPGKKAELDDPIILDRGSTLEDAAQEVHKDFRAKLKYARIWGSGKHDGVMAKRDHVLRDGDIIELHM
jgi:ribosome-interacting GTPase 1